MLNSVVWTDRNKGEMVLAQLTAGREPGLMKLIGQARPASVDRHVSLEESRTLVSGMPALCAVWKACRIFREAMTGPKCFGKLAVASRFNPSMDCALPSSATRRA
jgi:hypothetical protein